MDGFDKKIVIADSDRAVLEIMDIRLSVAGYRSIAARNGVQAIELLGGLQPAALIIDKSLQTLDAFEVLEHLNSRGRKPSFPILLTARDLTEKDMRRAASLGARDFMIKPFSGAVALERLGRTLKTRLSTGSAKLWD